MSRALRLRPLPQPGLVCKPVSVRVVARAPVRNAPEYADSGTGNARRSARRRLPTPFTDRTLGRILKETVLARVLILTAFHGAGLAVADLPLVLGPRLLFMLGAQTIT